MPTSFEPGTALIPGRHQPALLVDHLQSLDHDPAPMLAAAGLTLERLADPACLLTPVQYLQLLRDCARTAASAETSFMLGRQSLPGHFGAASHALLGASTLRRALQVLVAHPARLSPLLAPHLLVEPQLAALYWTDGCRAGGQRGFLVEMHMSAVASMCDWLAGERLPWRFCFNRTPPRVTEPHEAHLGRRLHFNCQLDAMLIDPAWLDRPWANPRAVRSASLQQALDREARTEDPRRSFLALLYDQLLASVHVNPGLERSALHFGISPATLKRRLAAHGTHFQAELDQVRLHVALRLMHCRGFDNDAVGRHLGIVDPTNFRRSVKRWSGLTPSLLRAALPSAWSA
jgi:AraC-like DNA-binding protein